MTTNNSVLADSSLWRIGHEMRRLRKARRETLAAVAKRANVSIGFLSQTERGLSTPSIKHLQKIADALGVTLAYFFATNDEPAEAEGGVVIRKNQRRSIDFGMLGGTDYLLSPKKEEGLELLQTELLPGATSGDQPYSHQGEEAGLVLSGQLELTVGVNQYFLSAGDSFGFRSDIEHAYRNPGDTTTIVIWAITPPGL